MYSHWPYLTIYDNRISVSVHAAHWFSVVGASSLQGPKIGARWLKGSLMASAFETFWVLRMKIIENDRWCLTKLSEDVIPVRHPLSTTRVFSVHLLSSSWEHGVLMSFVRAERPLSHKTIFFRILAEDFLRKDSLVTILEQKGYPIVRVRPAARPCQASAWSSWSKQLLQKLSELQIAAYLGKASSLPPKLQIYRFFFNFLSTLHRSMFGEASSHSSA